MTTVTGNDGSGVIYGCRELIDHVGQYKDLKFPAQLTDAPEMVLRGGCVGIQKMEYLPEEGCMSILIRRRASLGFMTRSNG